MRVTPINNQDTLCHVIHSVVKQARMCIGAEDEHFEHLLQQRRSRVCKIVYNHQVLFLVIINVFSVFKIVLTLHIHRSLSVENRIHVKILCVNVFLSEQPPEVKPYSHETLCITSNDKTIDELERI
jgi:hypothetical protein